MDTAILTETAVVAALAIDLEALRIELEEARENKEAAWQSQCRTTAEEGFTPEQAEAAVNQALDAEREYRRLWHQYDSLKAAAINAVEDAEIDVTPMGGW